MDYTVSHETALRHETSISTQTDCGRFGMTDESPTETGAGIDPVHDATLDAAPTQGGAGTGLPSVSGQTASASPRATVAGRVWVAIGVAVVVLVLLIIFIAQNSREVTISFLGANGTLSLGLAMLIAAVAGVVITLLVGTARIFQLRREVRRHSRRARASR
jgi:uncharacterized integral membrane protein